MDKQYSREFFSSFVSAVQDVCRVYLDFNQNVDVSGYLAVELDGRQRERYVLSELIHASGTGVSESYCIKAFKTVPPVQSVPRSTSELKHGVKRRRKDSLDRHLDMLITHQSPCPSTSGSDCGMRGYRSSLEGASVDTSVSRCHSRDSSPVQNIQRSLLYSRSSELVSGPASLPAKNESMTGSDSRQKTRDVCVDRRSDQKSFVTSHKTCQCFQQDTQPDSNQHHTGPQEDLQKHESLSINRKKARSDTFQDTSKTLSMQPDQKLATLDLSDRRLSDQNLLKSSSIPRQDPVETELLTTRTTVVKSGKPSAHRSHLSSAISCQDKPQNLHTFGSSDSKFTSSKGEKKLLTDKPQNRHPFGASASKGFRAIEDKDMVTSKHHRGDNVSHRGDNVNRCGDNVSRSDDNVSRSGDNVSRSGDNVSLCGDNVSRCGDNVSRRGDNVSLCGDNVSRCGDNVSWRGDNVSHRGDNVSQCGDNVSQCGDNVSHCGNNVIRCGDNVIRCGDNVSQCGVDNVSQCGGDNVNQCGDDVSQCEGDDASDRKCMRESTLSGNRCARMTATPKMDMRTAATPNTHQNISVTGDGEASTARSKSEKNHLVVSDPVSQPTVSLCRKRHLQFGVSPVSEVDSENESGDSKQAMDHQAEHQAENPGCKSLQKEVDAYQRTKSKPLGNICKRKKKFKSCSDLLKGLGKLSESSQQKTQDNDEHGQSDKLSSHGMKNTNSVASERHVSIPGKSILSSDNIDDVVIKEELSDMEYEAAVQRLVINMSMKEQEVDDDDDEDTHDMSAETDSELDAIDRNIRTAQKTRYHLNLLTSHLLTWSETRPVEDIPCKKLDTFLSTFFATVRKESGDEYDPMSLSSIQSSIDRHLRKARYPYSIKKDGQFAHSREVLEARQRLLRSRGEKKQRTPAEITEEEISHLYETGQLGMETPHALLNTAWFLNNVHFGLRSSMEHYYLKWGDMSLETDDDGQQFLQMKRMKPGGKESVVRVPASEGVPPERCCVSIYKKYKSVRPPEMCRPDSPFYLTVNHHRKESQCWYKAQTMGYNKFGSNLRKMAAAAGLNAKKFSSTAVKLAPVT